MAFSGLAQKYRGALVQSRMSPISRSACILTFGLMAVGCLSSMATNFTITSLPNILPLVLYVVVLDVITQVVPQSKIVEAVRTLLYGVLYLVITILCGVLAAYAMQRFAFPLQDRFLERADVVLGLDWAAFAHWVDRHATVQGIFHFAYDTIKLQIALPLVVLAFTNRLSDVRTYLLAFSIAFIATIFVSALLPAAGPIAFVDRTAFDVLRFTGATPIDHLMRLREAGPLVLNDPPGGIATFPSFHATVAVLTPLALRRYRPILAVLIFLNSAMLAATVTEGAHYFVDVLAGSCMAIFAYCLASYIIGIEDRSFQRTVPSHQPANSVVAGCEGRPA
jgi:membrane-associated phospholipid phosphatase